MDLFKTTFTLEFHAVVWYSYHFSIKLAYYKIGSTDLKLTRWCKSLLNKGVKKFHLLHFKRFCSMSYAVGGSWLHTVKLDRTTIPNRDDMPELAQPSFQQCPANVFCTKCAPHSDNSSPWSSKDLT